MNNPSHIIADVWQDLKQLTPARLALGRAGMSLPTQANLEFSLAHALARDAVNIALDFNELALKLNNLGYRSITLQSCAENHRFYLQRPDLGRLLNTNSIHYLNEHETNTAEVVIIIADGLSSKAISNHAINFLKLLLAQIQENYTIAPLCLIKHARVAIGDALAEHYKAKHCIVLIGERPGLSSPDSMGIYFTYEAKLGISTDANRNCISNIHSSGLSYQDALIKLLFLMKEAEKLKFSGVLLKDETVEMNLEDNRRDFNHCLNITT